MSAIQPPLAAAPHRNQQLFSDHYLNAILPQRPEWQLLAGAAQPVLEQLRPIFAAYKPSNNEAQTERDLVRPVLEALGHSFEVQAALRTPRGTKKPDYVFYRDNAALVANKDRVLDAAALAGAAFAIGDAKYWDRPLDVSLRLAQSGADINKIPSDQIAFYMLHSGVPWGILTNGRLWRLYHKDTAQQQTHFYEVDLAALVETGDVEAFLYAYAFFHRAAFEPHALGLDQLLKSSADYARGISEGLKAQVYDALRHLAQGFLDYPANGLQPDASTLKAIYDHSLIVLYRLLFILYAEARELLPVRASDAYREEYSLDAVKREVARRKTYGPALLPTTARLWAKLRDLFQIISLGSPPLKVATFNGGLFDAARYPFLERSSVGDARLQEAIDMLVRVSGEFVDYRDLAERNLGTIYEGLLEYQLQPIAPEGAWTVDLFNDRGERHRTGSYYTPDFVVQYIVAQTLGPVLDAAVAGKTSDAEKIAAVLAVNVVDLAMGSGHFPVAATDYIARYLVDLDVVPDGEAGGEPDLLYWKRRVAQSCIYGVDLNPLAVDLAKLSLWLATAAKDRPLSFLDHHLRCGNALVGSRVADLAVTTGSTTKRRAPNPKSKIANGQSAQLSLLDDSDFARSMSTAVGSMWLIEGSAGNTVAEVKEQERVYAALRDELTRRYARVANLVAATHFGLAIDPALWQPLADFAAGRALAAPAKFSEWIAEAERLADAQRFFHWELEFPEVFFDRNGQPLGERAGFDAVIGNPPYVRQELLAPFKPFFGQAYADVYHGVADISVYFLAQGVRLLQQGGALSYITSGMFRKLDYGQPLRRWLAATSAVESIVGFGEQQVFTDATTYPIVITVRRVASPADAATLVHEAASATDLQPVAAERYALPVDGAAWTFVTARLQHVLNGWVGSRALREHLAAPIYRGVTTGLNDAFVLDNTVRAQIIAADPASAALIKPYLRGEDLQVWYQKDSNIYLLFARRGINIEQFPGALEHLRNFRERLEPRPKMLSVTASWAGRKSGQYEWYEVQDSVDYYGVFEAPRIHSTKVTLYPTFSLLEPIAYAGNTSYVLPLANVAAGYFLLGILNSHVSEYYGRSLFAPKANGYYEVQPEPLARFPIPDAPASEREAIGALAMEITEEARARYALHRRAWRRVMSDLAMPGTKLNQKLTAWWYLDFAAFRAEVQKAFKRDIVLKDRDEWEEWLQARRDEHQRRTQAIINLETQLNARVYALFGLSEAEIALIEASTKYRYGEV